MYHPPLTVGMAAVVIGLVRKMPFVYDIQDLWPDTLESTGMVSNRHALALVACACRLVYRRASAIIAQSPGFESRLLERGVPREKLHMIYNWCDETALAPKESEATMPPGMEGRFNIVFAGNMGPAQALDAVLLAARDAHAADPRIQFVFVGDGVQVAKLQALSESLDLGKAVMFLPRMPITEVSHVLQAADVLLVHLRDDPLFSITVPSKTQAYLFSGKPILMAVHGDAANLVNQAGAAICAEPENAESIAHAAVCLAAMPREDLLDMGRRGKEFYEKNLSVKVGIARLVTLLEQACNWKSRKGTHCSIEKSPAAAEPSQARPGGMRR